MTRFGFIGIPVVGSLSQINIPESINTVQKVNENLPQNAQLIRDATFLKNKVGQVAFVYAPFYAFDGVSKPEMDKFKVFLGEYLCGTSLKETTQNSSVPHTPGKHLKIKDEGHREENKRRVSLLKRLLGVETL